MVSITGRYVGRGLGDITRESQRVKERKKHDYQRNEAFSELVKKKLAGWYNAHENEKIDESNVFIVWSCKTLQNYKCLAATTVSGDGIYAEYTYNGDAQELYEDVYKKLTNTHYTEE